MIQLKMNELEYKGETRPGRLFDGVTIVTTSDKSNYYRILFDEHGNPLSDVYKADKIAKHYNLRFQVGKLDGALCFINQTKQ